MVIGEPISLMGFAMLSTQRRAVADAAQLLVVSRGATSGWLYCARPGQIVECARHADNADRNIAGFREQHGYRVIAAPGSTLLDRDSAVADSAQWLFLNRAAVGSDFLERTESEKILRVCEIPKRWDAAPCPFEEKKYSLSDLRRAYDMGFGNSAEGWNQEIHPDYADNENYQQERLEALRELK